MDHLGYRKKLGALGPSTNTIVQPDFDDLRVRGVTNHYSRIAIPNDPVNTPEDFLQLVENINRTTLDAVDILRTCEMDYLVMGMSAATFWNGRKGAEKYLQMMRERAAIAGLRRQGETVVCVLPGHESEVDEFHCDRELARVADAWVVRAL